MELKKRWHAWLHKLAKRLGLFGTLDSEKALREKNAEIVRLKHELEQRQGFQVVYIDPTIRQKGYEQSAWNAEPERTTDPRTLSMRQRAVQHKVYPHVGDRLHHIEEVERQRFVTRKLNPTDTVRELPAMPPSPLTRKLRLTPLEDDTWPRDRKTG